MIVDVANGGRGRGAVLLMGDCQTMAWSGFWQPKVVWGECKCMGGPILAAIFGLGDQF